ncbi:MAG: ATP-binding cassette domain-containing protein [Flavobacteriales bacterium]|nr:ATP-binding cassette domain-containing protein [Flavobacteriales bacterium]
MEKDKKSEKKKVSKESFRRALGVFRYLKPHAFLFSIGLLLLVISGLLVIVITALLGQLVNPQAGSEIAGGAMTQTIIDSLQFSEGFGTSGQVLTALVGLLIIQGIFSFFRVYIFSYVTENAMLALRRDAFSTIIRMPMQFFNERRVGDLSSRLSSDITTIQETLTVTMAEFIRQTVIIVVGVGWLVSYSYKLTLVMLLSLPVIIIVMVLFGRFIRKLGKNTQDKVAESSVIVNESLTGIVNVKSFANEFYETTRFAKSIFSIKDIAMKSAVWRGMFGTFIIIFLFGALGLVMGVGAHLQSTGELPGDVLGKFIFITGLVAGSIGGLASQMGTLQRSIGVIESVMEILSFKTEEISLDQQQIKHPLKGDITFSNVSFHYESRPDVPVLRDVSFTAQSGQQVALVGSSGSGKSTIAALLQQFYLPIEGKIQFDHRPASDYSLTELRSQMAFVPQEVILFGGTIRENIAYGKPDATEEEIMQAASQANALQFIQSFPEGLGTIVGERGIQLSGGQRQRIAIARAVLRNPTILILDEATSSLDSESERQVQDALDKLMKGRTSIVIAHRLSTIRNADKILVLEKGMIREEGNHETLIARGGLYKRLSELQFEKDTEYNSPN